MITNKGWFKKGHDSFVTREVALKISAALKGRVSPMRGRKHSSETRERISKSAKEIGAGKWSKGRVVAAHVKELISVNNARYWLGKKREDISGERCHLWRGGVTATNKGVRNSVEYKNWRRNVFKRDGYRCVLCGTKGYLEADHIAPFAFFPELRFETTNGRTLCKPCHRETPTYAGRARLA